MKKTKISSNLNTTQLLRQNVQLVTTRMPLNDQFDHNIISTSKQKANTMQKNVYYKNFWDFFWISMILAISSLEVGYSLCQTAAVPILVIMKEFHITINVGLAHGLLLGIWPFGGIFGAMINSYLVRRWKKKWIYYFIGAVNLLSTILMQITTFQTVLMGRFLLGVTCGMYPMLAPVMTKELTPSNLRPLLGSFYSMARIIGIVFCFGLGVILQVEKVPQYWRIIFVISGIIGVAQTVMVYFLIPDVPGDLIQRGQHEKVQQIVKRFYHEQYVPLIIKQYQKDHELKKNNSNVLDDNQDPYAPNKKRAFIMAIHLNIYTQFIGVNTITLLSGTFMDTIYPSLSLYTNLIINSIRILPTVIATFWVGKKFGRRTLYLWSGIILGISNYIIVIGYLTQKKVVIIAFLFFFMLMFSLLYTPINYVYAAEITPAPKITIANIFNQAAMTATLLLPPIIIQKMDGNGYPIFLFFGVYTTISFIYMYKYLIQTKGKNYEQIIKNF